MLDIDIEGDFIPLDRLRHRTGYETPGLFCGTELLSKDQRDRRLGRFFELLLT